MTNGLIVLGLFLVVIVTGIVTVYAMHNAPQSKNKDIPEFKRFDTRQMAFDSASKRIANGQTANCFPATKDKNEAIICEFWN